MSTPQHQLTVALVMNRLSALSTSCYMDKKYKQAIDEARELIIECSKATGCDSNRTFEQLKKDMGL